jgi:hypothetical protein
MHLYCYYYYYCCYYYYYYYYYYYVVNLSTLASSSPRVTYIRLGLKSFFHYFFQD